MPLKILFEDANLLVVDKPAGIDIEGIKNALPAGSLPAHRLDKDTSGVLLVAKNQETLDFLQKQFQDRIVEKKYICLVEGTIKENEGKIETLLGRAPGDKRKQKAYLVGQPGFSGKREAVSEFRVLEHYDGYTLLEVHPQTGRKHQIRAQMVYLGHPIAGDKLYAFKDQVIPQGLKRQFLHASFLRIKMPDGSVKEFSSELPENLKQVLRGLV